MSGTKINLVPIATRQSLELRRIAKGWVGVFGVAIIACTMIGAITEHRLQVQRARVAELAAKCEPTQLLMHRVGELSTDNNRLNTIQLSLKQLLPTDDLLQTLGAIAQATSAEDQQSAKLRKLRISLSNAKLPGPNGSASLVPTSNAHINLQIVGDNDQQLQECLERLRNNPRIQEIQIRESGQEATTEQRQMEVDALVFVSKEVPQ